MILPVVALAAIVIGLVRGGRIEGLSSVSFRGGLAVLVLFVAQLAIRQFIPGLGILSTRALVLSWVVVSAGLLVLCALNWRIVGVRLLAVGIALNIVVVALNTGMPVGGPLAARFGMVPSAESIANRGAFYRPVDSGTIAPLLGDVMPIPAPQPLRSLVSIGDVLMFLAVGVLIEGTIRRARYRPKHSVGSHESLT